MKGFKISYEIKEQSFCLALKKDGAESLRLELDSGRLSVLVLYDYSEKPLCMSANASRGDLLDVVLLDYRIELYVNGKLLDEEWPVGNRQFLLGDEFFPNYSVEICEFEKTYVEEPCVISSFEDAEGWRPGNGAFVGDCMPYVRGDEYHVLYLKDRHHHKSKWGFGAHQWEHISTKDFKTWSIHPTAIPISEAWEGSICTGSHIKNGDTEYLFYTVRRMDGQPAPILRSISSDGYHFTKDKSFSFTLSDKYDAANARDPKIIRGEDGVFHMLLTTKLKKEQRGCLAHCVSHEMEAWKELDEPFYVAPDSHSPECPDYLKLGDKYYLIFSLSGVGRYMISDKPFEGFSAPDDPISPCPGVPKGALWGDRIIFTGFRGIDGYGGTMTFLAARADEGGELVFEKL